MRVRIVSRMPAPARLAAVAGGTAVAAMLIAACGSGSSGSTGASTGAAAASGSASGPAAMVITTATSSAGAVLTDGSGRAVYHFDKDTGNASACSGACASEWPPVTTTGAPTASGGAKSSDLGTITRSDGTKQVTYDGHPLYYYADDSGPGTAHGQGNDDFGATWWLVGPAGSNVTGTVTSFTMGGSGASTAPSAPAPAASSAGAGGYGY